MMIRLVRASVALGIVAFWLHSMHAALQLDRAATPRDLRVGRASYEILLARALERDPLQYLGIYQGSRRIGYAWTEVRRANTRFLVRNKTVFTPQILAIALPTSADTQIRIGPDFLIEQFTCDLGLSNGGVRVRFQGQVEGNELVVTALGLPMTPEPQTVRLSRDVTLFNGLSPFVGVPQLEVGETWTLQGLDVSSLAGGGLGAVAVRPKILTATVLRREPVTWEGRTVEAYVAAIAEDPGDPLRRRAQAWIAPDGMVLQEEHRVLSWVFTFKRETPPDKPGWTPWY
jgi:hypothetical protein